MAPGTKITIAFGGALLAVGLGLPAEAKVVCKKGFQLVEGSPLATPYCQDQYVAEVALEYGFKAATPARVRQDPIYKQTLCRFIGQDIRIKQSCDEVNPAQGRF